MSVEETQALMRISRDIGEIKAFLKSDGRRLDIVETWQKSRPQACPLEGKKKRVYATIALIVSIFVGFLVGLDLLGRARSWW